MRYLRFVSNLTDAPYRDFADALADGLHQTGCHRLIDLCSGASGPLPSLLDLLEERGLRPHATLTDLYPNARSAPERLAEHVDVHPGRVDARHVPAELSGFRLLCNAFHHFQPDDARQILADAVEQREGIAIVEMVERRWGSILLAALGLVWVPLMYPFFGVRRLDHALFIYLVPLIPLLAAFDGVVSSLRA
ncbi:MAG: hypothetical protein AAF211_06725, partial [Myxococcota bacterium]